MSVHDRLAAREARPALMRLDRALSRLGSVLTVMNTGAHPDDEHSGLMAWFRYGLGMRVVIACSTRGEGGQNALGPERGSLLGLLRTREMEEAARVLDCDVAWTGFGMSDPLHDFGFSKDGDATFARWGEELITARMARVYRQYRPDVILPTFLDVPGQHGHHRAMTRAAANAIALAADPAGLPNTNLSAWQVSHHYLPAWGGGGGTYDDTLPPPPATLRIEAAPRDAATGAAYAEIGQWSRLRHATQGMGSWSDTPQIAWDLHRVNGTPEAQLAEDLPRTLADLALLSGPASEDIAAASAAIDTARTTFPDAEALLPHLAKADAHLEAAQSRLSPDFAETHGHRISRKRRELVHAMAEAAGLSPVTSLTPSRLTPGHRATLHVAQSTPCAAEGITLTPRLPEGCTAPATPLDGASADIPVDVAPDAPIPAPFLEVFDPLGGNGHGWLHLSTTIAGRHVTLPLDLEDPVQLTPARTVTLTPTAFVRSTRDTGPLTATLTDEAPLTFDAPEGWQVDQQGRRLTVTPAKGTGLATLTPMVDGVPARSVTTAVYPHTGPVTLLQPAALKVLTLDLALPEGARIAYIGSGDSVGAWMACIGLDVTLMDRIPAEEDFSGFTTVLVGVVAFGNRADLAAAVPRLHAFTRAGGHLVTLYQRPDQGWDPQATPPRPLTIGQPSLRWRVTDPAAAVTVLAPDHALLTTPNAISAAEFEGWDKERGLYFASDWDEAYTPLLSMSDPGEDALTGALVTGIVGAGRHTHCSLVLHHQLDHLVPGVFRLLANLVQPA